MTKTTTTTTPPPLSIWRPLSLFLVVLVFLQWALFLSVLDNNAGGQQQTTARQRLPEHDHANDSPSSTRQLIGPTKNFVRTSNWTTTIDTTSVVDSVDGVAATVMLRAPRWFHKRYTVMLHNVLVNVPTTWAIQIFSNEPWLTKDVLPLHPGLQTLRSHPRIIWTPLPSELTRKKPKEIMKSTWLWEHVMAENVLLFGGNGALCGNAQSHLEEFLTYDYVGVPWGRYYGQAGSGETHSFRHRSAMLRILRDHDPKMEMDMPDYQYFVKHMLENNVEGHQTHVSTVRTTTSTSTLGYRVANKSITYSFGGVISDNFNVAPLLVSGTQASLNWTAREALLGVCPEVKMIFPSLHEPACFGAHPNGVKCKTSICALQDTIPSHGC